MKGGSAGLFTLSEVEGQGGEKRLQLGGFSRGRFLQEAGASSPGVRHAVSQGFRACVATSISTACIFWRIAQTASLQQNWKSKTDVEIDFWPLPHRLFSPWSFGTLFNSRDKLSAPRPKHPRSAGACSRRLPPGLARACSLHPPRAPLVARSSSPAQICTQGQVIFLSYSASRVSAV
jgi:hypothetical protein